MRRPVLLFFDLLHIGVGDAVVRGEILFFDFRQTGDRRGGEESVSIFRSHLPFTLRQVDTLPQQDVFRCEDEIVPTIEISTAGIALPVTCEASCKTFFRVAFE